MENYSNRPLALPSLNSTILDPKDHTSKWFQSSGLPPFPEPSCFLGEPPIADRSLSLFDSSEKQFLTGFFDNLVEDKNEFIIPAALDFSALFSGYNQHQKMPSNTLPVQKPQDNSQYNILPYTSDFNPNSTFRNSFFNNRVDNMYTHVMPKHHTTPLYSADPSQDMSMPSIINDCGDLDTNYPPLKSDSSITPNRNLEIPSKGRMGSYSPYPIPNELKTKAPALGRRRESGVKNDQRKTNHIASEQKRRDLIKLGFEQLTEIVPALQNTHLSKATVLNRAAEYLESLLDSNRSLEQQIEELKLKLHKP